MADHDRAWGFRTRAIHAGNIPDAVHGARALPIYQSSAFVFDDTADAAARFALQKYGNIYSRLANPTIASFEERVASLEGGLGAVATAPSPPSREATRSSKLATVGLERRE
jgi:O-acetylhomoserine (thiol)-lyase